MLTSQATSEAKVEILRVPKNVTILPEYIKAHPYGYKVVIWDDIRSMIAVTLTRLRFPFAKNFSWRLQSHVKQAWKVTVKYAEHFDTSD